jgi:hypothetical protein
LDISRKYLSQLVAVHVGYGYDDKRHEHLVRSEYDLPVIVELIYPEGMERGVEVSYSASRDAVLVYDDMDVLRRTVYEESKGEEGEDDEYR